MKLMYRYVGYITTILAFQLLDTTSIKCPPAPDNFDTLDQTPSPPPLQQCNELQQHDRQSPFEAVQARLKRCTSTTDSSAGTRAAPSVDGDCRWQVVNLGLEKTGTSEVANLLRLLNISGLSFASPRGAANGLKVLERCACTPGVKFVLTARNLLDMVVSRMSYHHWSCQETPVDNSTARISSDSSGSSTGRGTSSSISGTVSTSSYGSPSLVLSSPTNVTRHARCGGQDPSCCWRRDPWDLLQSWVLCRDTYHLRIVQLLAAAQAADRLLVVSLLHEGEHRVFSRLTHFIKHGQLPRDYAIPRGQEATLHPNYTLAHASHGRKSGATNGGGSSPLASGTPAAAGRRGHRSSSSSSSPNPNKAIKLLRRPTNRQQYPPGLKLCLRNWAESAFVQPPLEISPERFNAPLLALSKHYDHSHGSGGSTSSNSWSRSGSRKRSDSDSPVGKGSGSDDPADPSAAVALFALGESAWGSDGAVSPAKQR